MKCWILVGLLSIGHSALAIVSGTEGHGGDGIAAEFEPLAHEMLNSANMANFPANQVDIPRVLAILENTTVNSTQENLFVHGQVVDAENWPFLHLITVNEPRWNALSRDERRRLVVHEVISVSGYDDHNYVLSDAIVTLAKSTLFGSEKNIRTMPTMDCLAVPNSSLNDAVQLVQFRCLDIPDQHWIFEALGNGRYKIVSSNSGKCLDITASSTQAGAPLIQYTCHGLANQQFELLPVDGLMFRIQSVVSKMCLEITDGSMTEGAGVVQEPCNAAPGISRQIWSIESAD